MLKHAGTTTFTSGKVAVCYWPSVAAHLHVDRTGRIRPTTGQEPQPQIATVFYAQFGVDVGVLLQMKCTYCNC